MVEEVRFYRKVFVHSEDSAYFPDMVCISVEQQPLYADLDSPSWRGIKSVLHKGFYTSEEAQEIGKEIALELSNFEIPVLEFVKPKHKFDASFLEGFVEGIREVRGLDSSK